MKSRHPFTFGAHAGGHDGASADIAPVLHMSSTYLRTPDNGLVDPRNIYGRDQNDTVRQVEAVISQLEQGDAALVFPSGMAAIAAVIRSLDRGQTLLLQSGIYWGTTQWVRDYCERWGIDLIECDLADTATWPASNPDMVFVETPSNPWLKVVDIAAIRAGYPDACLVIDSTAATPILTRPLTCGADIVVHSATKALSGHSDVLAGTLVAKRADDRWGRIAKDRQSAGAILGPFEAWLLLRSLRTLHVRVLQMCKNAQDLATRLEQHPQIQGVLYPGLPIHPQHNIACQQMDNGFGYLMSILVRGGRQAALDTLARLAVFQRATSLGGVESLVEHRHTIEPDTGIPENLLRLSIGIEHIDDLWDDLDQALRGAHA